MLSLLRHETPATCRRRRFSGKIDLVSQLWVSEDLRIVELPASHAFWTGHDLLRDGRHLRRLDLQWLQWLLWLWDNPKSKITRQERQEPLVRSIRVRLVLLRLFARRHWSARQRLHIRTTPPAANYQPTTSRVCA